MIPTIYINPLNMLNSTRNVVITIKTIGLETFKFKILHDSSFQLSSVTFLQGQVP